MKIVIYSHAFAPSIGGSERAAFELAKGLLSCEPCPTVCVVTQTKEKDEREESWPFAVVRGPGVFRLWKLLFQADVIHLGGPALLPLVLGTLLGKPIAVEHYGYQAICPNGLLLYSLDQTVCSGRFQQRRYAECLRCNRREAGWFQGAKRFFATFLRYGLCRRSAANIGISQHVVQRLGLPHSETIYYGVDEKPFLNKTLEGHRILAYVGRLVPEKGLAGLLKAAALLERSDFEIWFIGDGPERPSLAAQVQVLNLQSQVKFFGFLTGVPLEQTLDRVDAVVMPSIWEETAGLAAMEHMMRGRVVIAADMGGLGEVVGETGLKFPMGDEEKLKECLQRVIEQPSLVVQLGQKARDRARSYFQRHQNIEKHWLLYQRLVSQAAP